MNEDFISHHLYHIIVVLLKNLIHMPLQDIEIVLWIAFLICNHRTHDMSMRKCIAH